ncbi:NAD(P)H-dependent oxidoreductase [Patescibacteria group bacterium AH-259-L07]|nr:NAD(P)H-dependent oxidoreductase [Patescibacteria group bacterium AH-259-L07]
MDNKILLIFGSLRSDGTTRIVVDELFRNKNIQFIDLLEKNVAYYDYDHHNSEDDFLQIAKKMTHSKSIIFVTPIYWYSMSAIMKTFFDRFTDLLQVRKDLGKKLKNKRTYLIVSGTDQELPIGFEIPFARTSKYFDMKFKGYFYHYVKQEKVFNEDCRKEAKNFVESIFTQ